jgi:hypothetical protein
MKTLTMAVGLLALWGCASAQLTPQQERALAAFEECKRTTNAFNVFVDRVAPDGTLSLTAMQTPTDADRVIACLKSPAALRRVSPR